MIKIQLTEKEIIKLKKLRKQASSNDSEKILMVLLSHEGFSPPSISKRLKRHPHTVRQWLKRFQSQGLMGLQRHFSPGRPDEKRKAVKEILTEILSVEPTFYGYKEFLWSVPLIVHYLKNSCDTVVSDDTVERALKAIGFSYKRPSKSVSPKAPNKETKKATVEKIVSEIKELMAGGEWEIFALDESHFSTEPYIVRGWIKKRWPPENCGNDKTRKRHVLWCIESKDTKILLEKISTV